MIGQQVYALLTALAVTTVLFFTACADRRPTCADNPRNMQCFTADELQKELSN